MSLSKLRQTIAHYRAMLRAREATAEHALQYAHQQTVKIIQSQLDTLYQAMLLQAQSGQEISLLFLYEANRLETIERMITGQIDHFAALAQQQVGQLQYEGARLGVQAGTALLEATVPANIAFSFGMPSMQAIANLVGATQAGSPLADLFSGFGAEAAQKASTALISGVTLGYNPRDIAPMVQDALNISRNRALTISRDQLNRAYRSANQETFSANADVVRGWRWTCSLSPRTCAACLSEDGSEHPLDEDMESHTCCRCVPVPITSSWSDILGPLGIDTSGIDDSSWLDDMQSGTDWFAEQDAATQTQVLGKSGYDLYASGDVTLQDFVGHASDPVWGNSIYQRPVKDLVKP
jgi:hypothetical protein